MSEQEKTFKPQIRINLVTQGIDGGVTQQSLPEIGGKMAVVCLLICIQSIHNGLSFLLGNR